MKGNTLAFLTLASIIVPARGQEGEAPLPQGIRKATAGQAAREDLETNFDRGLFGRIPATKPGSTPIAWITGEMARAQLAMQLTLKIDEVERLVPLGGGEKKKLRAAGEQDIRRFFDHIGEVKESLRLPSGEFARGRPVGTARTRLGIEYRAGLFGSGSYFAKVLATIVDETQAEVLRKAATERNRARRRTRALLMAQSWGDALGLDSEQRRKLFDLIDERIPLPERNGLGDYPYLIYQFNEIPRDQLRPIFNEMQWKTLTHHLDQIKPEQQKARVIELGFDLGEAEQAKPKPEAEQAK